MPPTRLKLNITRRNGGAQSSQQDDTLGSPPATISAKGSDNTINKSNGLEKAASSGTYIKQEPTSGIANVPSTTTSRPTKTCATALPGSAVTEGELGDGSSYASLSGPNSMDADNDSNTTNVTGNKADTDAPHRNVRLINGIPEASEMSDTELVAYLEYHRSEEDRLPANEDRGYLADFYDRKAKEIRNKIQEIEDEQKLRQLRISSARTASKGLGLSNLAMLKGPQPRQSDQPVKRLLRKRKPGTQPRPFKRPKMSKETRQIKDTVMKGAFLVKGEVSAAYDKDAMKTLPQISEAPTHLRDHLTAIMTAALRNPDVDKDLIDHDLRTFAGILVAVFGDWIDPWVSPGDGPKKVGDYKWRLKGMSEPLHHHQLPAIGIMLMSEKNNAKDEVTNSTIKSGFLFDYMGLGKTVEILGCITVNFPPFRSGNRSKHGRTTTLIVVPKSAVLQWEAEVQRHCQGLRVGLYENDSEMEPEETLSNDFLLVTYDQLLGAERVAGQKKKPRGKPRVSLLFKSHFHRVVLDEAHRIKSKESATFRVCCKLQATHRWCATGTPTPNGIAELYSYLKFIQHPQVNDFSTFRDQYLGGRKGKLFPKGVENKYEQLHRLLEQIMIMRNPGHKLLGGALIELPETHFHATSVPLSIEETVIYEYVEKHIEEYINKRSGKKPKAKILPPRPRKKTQDDSTAPPDDEGLGFKSLCEVALRLRQLVASPLLLEHVARDGLWTIEQVRQMKDEAYKRGCSRVPFIDQFESWISGPRICQRASRKANRLEQTRNKLNSLCCPVCNKPRQQEPHKSQCGCICCKRCIEFRIDFCKRQEMDINCIRCNMPIGTPVPCGLPGELSSASGQSITAKPRMRGDDFLRFQPKEDFGSTLFQVLDTGSGTEIPLSSKLQAILDQIQSWQSEAPEDKIILFFQFIGIQRLLARVLQDHGIEFLYFVGEMDFQQREAAKEAFRTKPEIKVLVSLSHYSLFAYAPSDTHFR